MSDEIIIGDNVNVAMRCTFITSTHEINQKNDRRAGKVVTRPIVVGNGVWIGANSVILPGVTVGDGTIVAAGSVIITDCEANAIYAGVPAKQIRSLTL